MNSSLSSPADDLAVARLRRLILDSPALQAELDQHGDLQDLAAAAAAVGAAQGCPADAAAVLWAIMGDTPWEEFPPGPPPAGPGWLPGRLVLQGGAPAVAWCRLDRSAAEAPFYGDTVRAAMRRPLNRLLRSSTPLSELPPAADQLPLAGLIFHMSRCGSTLVAQALGALPQLRALSEPDPFDDALRLLADDPAVGAERRAAWLRAVAGLLGRGRRDEERAMLLKLDSWHIFDLALIRRAFPATPWAFVCRDPLEVLVSHRRRRGSQMIPGTIDPRSVGVSLEEAIREGFDAYAARVLARFCAAAAAGLGAEGGRLLRYEDLPAALWGWLPAHFGLQLDAAGAELIRAATGRDAKRPWQPFADDRAEKRATADPELRDLAERLVGPAYDRLLAAGADGLRGEARRE